ncbi:LacI family DNA-binding transcriptional regulator [Bacillus massiliglaciei]|uniref:LacI family DNA-binding transcriptional regulator n=1 Tax=Bacillus massiliglaciei TaxID=1816693 RepID=UPI000DA60550|nr:LacI family DNA-binding transcriptional regulator [Bacillus massiliglaciei]
MSITIKDVAQLAEVAPSTVSRVIANNPRISEKTKVRVREAMEKLGYHPNFIARSLANQSTKILGLVLPGSADVFYQNPFFPTVLRGLSEGAQENQYSLLLSTGKTEEEIYEGVVNMVQGGMVDGIILLYSRVNDHILSYLRSKKFPFVLIGKPFDFDDEITYIDNDNYTAAKEATSYLIELGHEKIGFISGDSDYMMTKERLKGYVDALTTEGIPIKKEYIIENGGVDEGGKQTAKRILSLAEPPTALIIGDDLLALGMANSFRELGIRVPDHLSMISFNNAFFSDFSSPQLTSVDINIFDLGYQASRSLIHHLKHPGSPASKVIIPHQFIERCSCKGFGKMAMTIS